MQIRVIDTETTGVEDEDVAVEIAVVTPAGDYEHSLLCPGDRRISFGAMAVHHITEEMTAGTRTLDEWITRWSRLLPRDGWEEEPVMVAHNAEFDKKFLPESLRSLDWICTWRCALALLPDAESHGNMALRYELGLDVSDMPGEAGGLPHRALYDAWVTMKLLEHLVDLAYNRLRDVRDTPDYPSDEDCYAELVRITREPILLKTVKFGKHSGELWAEVPTSYMHWVRGQDFDRDVLHTVEHWLRQRGALR